MANTLEERLRENAPDASLTVLAAIDETYYRYTAFNILCIDGRLSEKEVEQVFTYFFQVIFDGAKGEELLYCGVEGLYYEYDEDGNMQYLNTRANPASVFQSVWGSPWCAAVPF